MEEKKRKKVKKFFEREKGQENACLKRAWYDRMVLSLFIPQILKKEKGYADIENGFRTRVTM